MIPPDVQQGCHAIGQILGWVDAANLDAVDRHLDTLPPGPWVDRMREVVAAARRLREAADRLGTAVPGGVA